MAPAPKAGPLTWLAPRAETYQPEAPTPVLSRRTPLIVAPGLRTSSTGSAVRPSATFTGSTLGRARQGALGPGEGPAPPLLPPPAQREPASEDDRDPRAGGPGREREAAERAL